MAIFKYTIANKEGKTLNGSVEAPDENTARSELGNLGFSILLLQEIKEAPQLASGLSKFIFEAIDKNSKLVTGTIPAKNEEEAVKKLQTEYSLNISAIWLEGATKEQIEEARKIGQTKIQNQLQEPAKTSVTISEQLTPEKLEEEKKSQFVKTKIETILKGVNTLLQTFEADLAPDQRVEINKKIDKLLRIKNSTNLDYILESANDLLKFLEEQEKSLKANTHQEKRFAFKVETQKMLNELNQQEHKKTLSEDILGHITGWQKAHSENTQEISLGAKIINAILNPIKEFFTTPPAILALQEQIKTYNKQIFEFIKLYFKEPTPEYKAKVRNSIKTIWQTRKNTKKKIKEIKEYLKEQKNQGKVEEHAFYSFVEEINALSGWLLAFYVIYYFISLYVSTKNFGLTHIPVALNVYESHLFKYILVITFLLHSTSAIKINFFKKSAAANFILPPIFIFGSIMTLLNF